MPSRDDIQRPYHHGDLFRTLVSAGMKMVELQGAESVSLREVARQSKVSHTAPYHYFSSKAGLLAAIAAEGFKDMVQEFQCEHGNRIAGEPREMLMSVGRGYVRFAMRRPSLFRLMFRPELTQPHKSPELREAEGKAFGKLFIAIQSYRETHPSANFDPGLAAAFAWSAVHGFVTLHLDAVFLETPLAHAEFETIAEAVLNFIVAGIESTTLN